MNIRKLLRVLFTTRHQMTLHKMLLREGIVFNWQPVFDASGHLSCSKQKILGKLIAGYIHGYTVTVHNETMFMRHAVRSFEAMKPPYNQDEFDALMET